MKNKLCPAGVKRLVKAISKVSETIEKLSINLGYNEITNKGVKYLSELRHLDKLTGLDLDL